MRFDGRRARLGRSTVLVAALAAVAVAGGTGFAIRDSQEQGRRAMEERTATRAEMGARFVAAYAEDVLVRAATQAVNHVHAEQPDHDEFTEAVSDLGFQAAVLLDRAGRLLDIHPAKPELLGTAMGDRYEHLRAALDGRATVSNVIGSAASDEPIVAFAVPYESRAGRRVFSAGFSIAGTPLGAFLRTALPFQDHALYLVDGQGQIVAGSDPEADRGALATVDPVLARSAGRPSGSYGDGGDRQYFVARDVAGTPWRLVLRVPTEVLYAPVAGLNTLPWAMFVVLVLALVCGVALLARLVRHRAHLTVLATRDVLTGLHNRRFVAEQLTQDRRNGGAAVATVLMVDVDHFKQVNDRLGHDGGDHVLQVVAERLQGAVREADTVGRWGGEEFIVVLPGTDREEGALVAERIRACVEAAQSPPVTVSIGCASGPLDDHLAREADRQLYLAKEGGRNRVATA